MLTLAQRYDHSLRYARGKKVTHSPASTIHWSTENILFYEQYKDWLLQGGTCEYSVKTIYLPIAGHVLGLNLKPHQQLNLDSDLQKALDYVSAKGVSQDWMKACRNGLNLFKRYLRLTRGLGEEDKQTPFDASQNASDLACWLVTALTTYQHLMQRNWRTARIEQNIRRFWSGYLRMFRFFKINEISELKRKQIFAYIDHRLSTGHSPTGVNADLRYLHTFLLFLQDEGYNIPQTLLRIPSLKPPEPLPKYLTDEQVRKLRDEVERRVTSSKLESHRRTAILVKSAFYLLWQGGMRLGEVEELRLEDLELSQKRLVVRDGKGRVDRTVYLTETAIQALQAYLQVRGVGFSEHVFLFRNAPLKKDLIRDNLKYAGQAVGVKVYPHRLRHTCATQLLNAGCKVTSIQRFLGHKKLSTTMVYAKAHDQTVAHDFFSAMQKIERNLCNDVKVQEPDWMELVQKLEVPELGFEERLKVVKQLEEVLSRKRHEFALTVKK
jgi:integrase/recombinase XerD